jgi:hypothetical protein
MFGILTNCWCRLQPPIFGVESLPLKLLSEIDNNAPHFNPASTAEQMLKSWMLQNLVIISTEGKIEFPYHFLQNWGSYRAGDLIYCRR